MSRAPAAGSFPVGLCLAGVLAYYLILAALTVGWGLPSVDYPYSYNCDEYTTFRCLRNMKPAQLDFNPRYFHNPTLYYYATGVALAGARGLGILEFSSGDSDTPSDAALIRRIYLTGRITTLAFGALAVSAVFFAGALLAGIRGGCAAGLLLASSFLWLCNSVLAVAEVPAASLQAVAVACGLAAQRERAGRLWIPAAGLALGLACATKYPMILSLPGVAGLVLAAPQGATSPSGRVRRLGMFLAAVAVGFLVGCPYAALDFPQFVAGIGYGSTRMQTRWIDHPRIPFLYPIMCVLLPGLGPGLTAAAAVAWPLALVRHFRRLGPLLLASGLPFVAVGLTNTNVARYQLWPLPIFCVLAGWMLAGLRPAWLSRTLIAVVVTITVTNTAVRVRMMREPDPRTTASEWMLAHVPEGATVGTVAEPYNFSPPVVYREYFFRGRSQVIRLPGEPKFHVGILGDSPGSDVVSWPQYFVVSDAEALQGYSPLLAQVFVSYEVAARFAKKPHLAGLALEPAFPFPSRPYTREAVADAMRFATPLDFKWLNPEVLVLRRRAAPPPVDP